MFSLPLRKRLLMLEFLVAGEFRNEKTMFYPYCEGAARQAGADVLRLCFDVDIRVRFDLTHGRTVFVDLPAEDIETLRRHCAAFRPTHVLSSDLLSDATARALAVAAGDPQLLHPGFTLTL
jgi:hypothetical protein